MRFAMHNWMRPEPLEVTVKRLSQYGYDAIEIMGEPKAYEPKATRKLIESHGLVCSGAVTLMTKDRDLAHADAKCRSDTDEYLKECIWMVHELGGEVMCVVPTEVGRLKPYASAEQSWAWVVEELKRVADAGRKCGVRIALEPLNRFETRFLNRGEQAAMLAREVGEDVGIALDTFHMNIEEDDAIKAIHDAGSLLFDFHVADSNRRPPGQGHLDWKATMAALKVIDYAGTVTCEFVNPIDYTPIARKPTVWKTPVPNIPGVAPEHVDFIIELGSGVLTSEDYDAAVRDTIQYLRSLT
jgi:D-psicose/D-tagatose/L-ribulose 3-epimerase